MTLSETILPGTVPAVVRSDTALYKHHGFWVPRRPVWYKRVIPGISNISRGAKHVIMRSRAPCDFFERLPLGLLIQFLEHLTETGDLDALRSLLMTYDWMRPLVIVIEDTLSSDVDLFHVKGLRHMALAEFLDLPPSDPTRRLPVRIFTVTGSSMRSFCSRDVYSVLSKNTPLIVRLFGPNTRLADDLRQFMEGGVIPSHLKKTLPLVLCQDSDKKRHPLFCFPDDNQVDEKACMRLIPWLDTSYKPFPFKRRLNKSPTSNGCGSENGNDTVEIYNIHGKFGRITNFWDNKIEKAMLKHAHHMTLVFSSNCTKGQGGRLHEPCVSPRFALRGLNCANYPYANPFNMRKLTVVFHGSRVPNIYLRAGTYSFNDPYMDWNPSELEIVNAAWSEANPSFGYLCQHSRTRFRLYGTQPYRYSVDADMAGLKMNWRMPNDTMSALDWHYRGGRGFASIKKVELVGIPDGALQFYNLGYTSELIWKRMSPVTVDPDDRIFHRQIELLGLTSLELHSIVTDRASLPWLRWTPKLENLHLVALPGSTHPWNINELVVAGASQYSNEPDHVVPYLVSGIKRISVKGDKSSLPVVIGRASAFVQSLTLIDCVPDFLASGAEVVEELTPFSNLRKLSLDAGILLSEDLATGALPGCIKMFLGDELFPCLEAFQLQCLEDRTSSKVRGCIELDVPMSCEFVGVSTSFHFNVLRLQQSGRRSQVDAACPSVVVSNIKFDEFNERWVDDGKREKFQWYKREENGVFKQSAIYQPEV